MKIKYSITFADRSINKELFPLYLALISTFSHRWRSYDLFFRATNFSYHLLPRREEKDITLVIRTHVSRVEPYWDLSDALPTEL